MGRLPRFERIADALALQLTAQDVQILRHVARHRFLSSRQILLLVGGSAQHMLKRLQKLFHAGFLDRPRTQLRYFAEAGSRPIAYGLATKGTRALAAAKEHRPRQDNRNVKQQYLDHTLLVADVAIAFVLSCRNEFAPRFTLLDDHASGNSPGTVATQWAVTVHHAGESKRVGVIPDRIFTLASPHSQERVLFCVEADRGTMPVKRRSLSQSSVWRKLLAYEASWAQDIHQLRFGCGRFRVLVVTSSPERAQHLASLSTELPRGRGLFLFTDADTLRAYGTGSTDRNIFALPWLTASGESERLSDLWKTAAAA